MTAGMVVCQDDSGSVRMQGNFHDFAGVDCSAVDRAAEQYGAFQYLVLAIEKHHREVLPILLACIEQPKVIEGLAGACHKFTLSCCSFLNEIQSLGYYTLLRGCVGLCSHGLIPQI